MGKLSAYKMSDSKEQQSKDKNSLSAFTRGIVKKTSIEPVIFLLFLGLVIVGGAAVNVNMLIWKVCTDELGYNETVCDNLSDEQYEDIEEEVQREVNDIQLVQEWLDRGSSLIYVFFSGAFSDHFGRKPILLWPLIGILITAISQIVNYAFLETLPVEFFYLENISGFFGGYSLYYLGCYSYGASFAKHPDDRGPIISRYDGFERLANIVGAALSPVIFDAWGYYGNYIIKSTCIFSSIVLVYLILFCKEPHKPEKREPEETKGPKENLFKRALKAVHKYMLMGTWDTMKTLFRERPNHMRPLLLVQFTAFGLTIFYYSYHEIIYLYIQLVFDATGEDYAHMNFIYNILAAIGLLVFVPLISSKLKMFEALINSIIAFSVTVGFFSMAFAQTMMGYFAAKWATFMMTSQFGPGRSLITKSVDPDELGKVLSGNAIISALTTLASTPAYRKLYDATLDTYPSAFLLMSGAISVVCLFLFLFLTTQKSKFVENQEPCLKREE